MTIICARATKDGKAWIGCDTRLTFDGGGIVPGGHQKWIEVESGLWLGIAGSQRLATMIRHKMFALMDTNRLSAPQLATLLVNIVRADGWKADDDESGPACHDFEAIIVAHGVVWMVHGTGAMVDVGDAFCAVGSGAPYAYGAALVAARIDSGGRNELLAGMEAACTYDSACGGKVWAECVE